MAGALVNGLRAGARGLGELLITVGLVLLLFVAWQLYWTDYTTGRAQAATTNTLQQQWDQAPVIGARAPSSTAR